MNFEYEISITDSGEIRISVVTKDAAVALLVNECIAKVANATLETMDMETAERERGE